MKARFFKLLTVTHRWVGMTVGLALAFIALTGAGQAFRDQLEPVVYGHLMQAGGCAERVALDTLLASAKTVDGAAAESIRFRPGNDKSVMVRFSDKQLVFLDPCSGMVLGRQAVFGGVFGALEYVHRLMVFENFRLVGGSITLIGVVMLLVGGITLWWPRGWREAKRSLTVDSRLKGMAFLLNLHKTAGLYGFFVLLVISFAGMAMALEWVRDGLYWAAGSDNRPAKIVPASSPEAASLPLEELWARAMAVLDDPRDVTVRLARKKGDPVQFTVLSAGAPHVRARDELTLDAASGETLRYIPYAQSSRGSKIYNWVVAIHRGEAGGVIGSAIVFCAALMIPLLAYSGVAAWLRRRRSRKALGRG